MINLKKTELMTKTAVYEQGEGYDALRLRSYFENGRTRPQLFIAGAITYLLIAFVIYIAAGGGLIDFAVVPLRSALCVTAAVALGVVFILIYVYAVNRLIKRRYRELRSSMVKYDIQKEKLMQAMQEGNTETVSD